MKTIKKIAILIAMLTAINASFADSIRILSKDKKSIPNYDTASTPKKEILTEGEAYRMLYENQVKSNDAILKTIYYALGGIASAVLLVFASNWWFNEKKVREVIKDIDAKIAGVKNEVVTDITAKIRGELKEDTKELKNDFQKQLEMFNENYRQQIASMNESTSKQITNAKELFDSKEISLKEAIVSEQKKRSDDVNQLHHLLNRVEYYLWDTKGVYRNAFKALVDELMHKLKTHFDIRDIRLNLRQMSSILDKVDSIYKSDKEEALSTFAALSTEDMELVNLKKEIEIKLNKAKIM